jgi:hypothetical protein
MFEFIILVAIVGGIWYYFESQKESSDGDSAPTQVAEVETAKTQEETQDVTVTEEPEEVILPVESSVVEEVLEAVKSKFVASMPEDSSLKRHYQQLLIANQAASNRIPEDVTLHRHFVQNLISEVEDSLPDAPTDSTLMRHYDALVTDTVIAKLELLK